MLNKRRFLADRMRELGLIALIERLARRPCLVVLAYHRIGDPAATPDYGPVFSSSPEGFRAQLGAINRAFRLLDPTELIDAAAGAVPVTEPCAAITFDDGYRDQFEHALPALVESGSKAILFVPPEIIDRPRPFWWDLVSRVIRTSTRDRLELDYPDRLAIDFSRTTRDAAIEAVINACLAARPLDEPRLAEHLEARSGVTLDADAIGREAMMTWEQVAAFAEAGMGIGSHGRTHRRLADLDEPQQREELAGSKRDLEERLGFEVAALSYPYGSSGDYDDRTRRLAREVGYRTAFTFGGGANQSVPADPFAVPRINVGAADTPEMVRARLAMDMAFGRSII